MELFLFAKTYKRPFIVIGTTLELDSHWLICGLVQLKCNIPPQLQIICNIKQIFFLKKLRKPQRFLLHIKVDLCYEKVYLLHSCTRLARIRRLMLVRKYAHHFICTFCAFAHDQRFCICH